MYETHENYGISTTSTGAGFFASTVVGTGNTILGKVFVYFFISNKYFNALTNAVPICMMQIWDLECMTVVIVHPSKGKKTDLTRNSRSIHLVTGRGFGPDES